MTKKRTIDSFFKKKDKDNEEAHLLSNSSISNLDANVESVVELGQPPQSTMEQLVQPPPSKFVRIDQERINIDTLIRDPGKRPPIWDYPINQQDEIRRAYIKFGPYQFVMDEYPFSGQGESRRRFQASWFRTFSWLEYSPEVDASFCFPCYLFSRKSSPFISKGFRNWRKVNSGRDCSILSHHNLNIQNVRGQGYDGASNMRGEFNGLQALILQECPYAYYVHCLAHQLQLALVASAREAVDVHAFFQNLNMIVNIASSSCKRNDELQAAYTTGIARLVANDDIETGRGANQVGTLQRPGDTRWGSHYNSIGSLLRLYNATTSVLEDLAIKGSNYSQRGDATYALKALISFEFVFILHLMKELMGITDKLCQALQQKSQDILNATCLVYSTKSMIQKLRDFGWDALLEKVRSFCDSQSIEVPNMSSSFSDIIRSRRQKDSVTVEHHYRIDVFNTAIDHLLKELNSRFSEQATELLKLSTALDPKDSFKLFNAGHICSLVEKFYSSDFSYQEKIQLEYELQHYDFDVLKDVNFQNLSTIGELCQKLVETRKSIAYPLLDRLLRLVLTLPVSTATTERAFSAMKLIKTRLRNKMEDDFLTDYMIVYIEKEIAEKYTTDMIIDDFYSMKQRRAQLQSSSVKVSSSSRR